MNIFKQALDKLKHQQQLLAILIFSFVAIMVWIATNLFTSQQRTSISEDLLRLAQPLTPTINQEVIQRIRKKGVFPDSQLRKFPIYMIAKDKGQVERIVEIGTEPEPSPSPSPSSDLEVDQTTSDLTK